MGQAGFMCGHSKGVDMLTRSCNSVHKSTVDNAFTSTGALLVHLEFRSRLEDYVEGKTQKPIAVASTACHTACSVGKWFHGEGGSNCKDVELVASVCRSCEEFYEAASNAVLLMEMGDAEMAKDALQDGDAVANASAEFQMNLTKLHQLYSAENPRFSP